MVQELRSLAVVPCRHRQHRIAPRSGVAGLENALLQRPEIFVGTLTEKLLTFALGRGIEPYDGPAVRRIVRNAKKTDYRFSSLIEGIATSVPFQMRKAP